MVRRLLVVLLSLALLALLAVGLLVSPVDTRGLMSRPQPASAYAAAIARTEQLLARDTSEINPSCRSRLFTHGQRAAAAIVLIHGFTNCPQQFEMLGQQFYERGYNVLIPRQPHHGLADRLTGELATLTAEELVTVADEAVDIAHGLGERVVVMGLSTGGVMTAWLAQERADVQQAIVLVPLFGPGGSPLLALPTTHLALLIPNQFVWWSAEAARMTPIGPQHAYPRYSTRAAGEAMRLGQAVFQHAARVPPRAQQITVVTVENDERVGNAITGMLVEQWQARGGVTSFVFPAHHGIPHDLIDPTQADQRVEIVYPKLIELVVAWP